MSSRKSKGRREQRLQELEVKKRNGFIQVIAAVVIMVVLILIKTTATIQGAAWANTQIISLTSKRR